MITVCPDCGWPSPDGSEILRCARCGYTKEFMDYEEFARLIGTTAKTISRWERTGRVKATRFGPRVSRIHRSEYLRLAGLLPSEIPET